MMKNGRTNAGHLIRITKLGNNVSRTHAGPFKITQEPGLHETHVTLRAKSNCKRKSLTEEKIIMEKIKGNELKNLSPDEGL